MKILGAECYGIVMPKSWNKPNSPESTRGVINRKALYTILRSPNGNRYTLYFYWNAVNRKWNWNYNWLDDFVFLSSDRDWLLELVPKIAEFLDERLKLSLHPDKIFIKTLASGVDFLGWVHFTDHKVLRTATKRKMFRKISDQGGKNESIQSYLGLLSHGNTQILRNKIFNLNMLK